MPLRGILRALHASLPTPCGRRSEAELTTLFGSGTGLGDGRQTSQGKVALITGVEHARLFIDEGAKAILMSLAEEAGPARAKELGETLPSSPTNAADAASRVSAVEGGTAIFGPITVLVNNAGLSVSNASHQADGRPRRSTAATRTCRP